MTGRSEVGYSYNVSPAEDSQEDVTAVITQPEFKDVNTNITLPVSDADFNDQLKLWDCYYFNNRSGCNLTLLATTHTVDYKNEAAADPCNYLIEICQAVPDKGLFKMLLENSVLVEWSVISPPNDMSPVWLPGITIPSPNGKTLTFVKRHGVVVAEPGNDARARPNDLIIKSTVSNLTITVRITKRVAIYGSGCQMDRQGQHIPDFRTVSLVDTVGVGKNLEYTHNVNINAWLVEFDTLIGPAQYGSRTNDIPLPTTSMGPNHRDVRIGSNSVYDFRGGLTPGSYIIALRGITGFPVFGAAQFNHINLMPVSSYVTPGPATAA